MPARQLFSCLVVTQASIAVRARFAAYLYAARGAGRGFLAGCGGVMRSRIFRWAGLCTVLAAGMALSACESPAAGSKKAAQIVPELQGAASTASSVHIAGSLIHGNQETTIDVGIKGDSAAGYLGAPARASMCCR